jgi:hypothetical protein
VVGWKYDNPQGPSSSAIRPFRNLSNPDCAALVGDLEAIADHARSLFELTDPSDAVWSGIEDKLKHQNHDDDLPIPQTV